MSGRVEQSHSEVNQASDIFAVCGFVLHNCVNLNIGLKLTLGQAVAHFVQRIIIGMVIGLIHKPLGTP